jgi:cytidine deaminase
MITSLQRDRLVSKALEVRELAYAPYSQFHVGAALLAEDGEMFAGCNVENCSYGLTICAERSAACGAIAQGKDRWLAIAIASRGAVTPCGACRQFLVEFGAELEVILVDCEQKKSLEVLKLSDLIPRHFTPERLRKT